MSFLQLRSQRIKNPLAYSPTVPVSPTVVTNAATGVGATSATGNGNVTSDGGSPITQRGFAWSLSANPTTSDSTVVDGSATTGIYSDTMATLLVSTLYHYRAYAINAIGTSYGADTTFTTSAATSGSASTFMMMGV